MNDNVVSREECEAKHAPITEFKTETNNNFIRVHSRLDGIKNMIIGVLLTIIAGIIVQLAINKYTNNIPSNIKIIIDEKDITKTKIED